jgi:hypothetical protein
MQRAMTIVLGSIPRSLLLMFSALPLATQACQSGGGTEKPIFQCEASGGKKYIELCFNDGYDAGYPTAPNKASYLVYRFGSLDEHQGARDVEFEYPVKSENSFKTFFGAIYDSDKGYTQSVRFVSGNFDYIVFTRWKGATGEKAADETSVASEEGLEQDGIELHNRKTGKRSYVWCSERPRFYINELKDLVACDKETSVGTACIR